MTTEPPLQPPVAFSEAYYREVMQEYGYDTFELERFDFSLGGTNADELNLRWLCHHRAQEFRAASADSRTVTTGFGMSGRPHMGTVGQILGMVQFQRAGERCQIVLGDLDAHNGKGRSLTATRELADRFGGFCRSLGFDSTTGVLRCQFDDVVCLRNLYLLGHYAEDSDFEHAEEDNHEYYARLGIVDKQMTFRRKTSLALMASDFLTLGQQYDAVLVLLGIDEHKYVRFAGEIARRLDRNTTLTGEFTLASIYSRLATGFGGHPKMSKSIPGSAISVDSTPDEIRARVMTDQERVPERSASYQLMTQLSMHTYSESIALARACTEASAAWRAARADLADYLISIIELW